MGVLAAVILVAVLVLATTPPDPPSFAAVRAGWRSSEARLLARDGQVLDIVRADPRVRRLDWVPLGGVSPAFVTAAVASEDKRFAFHHGVDWRGVGGAIRDRLHGRRGRGASTITMQLAGLLAGNRGGGRSWLAKIEQARAALAIERRWTKAEILEAWVNLLPFRGDHVGIDAAARALAGKPPAALDATEARVLVSLLPAPTASPGRVAARACRTSALPCARLELRTAEMLATRQPLPDPGLAPQVAARLMARGCSKIAPVIPANAGTHLPRLEEIGPRFRGDDRVGNAVAAPSCLIRTTLDADLQAFVATTLRQQLAALAGRNARDGAAIVVDNASGDILAYVGSAGPGSTSGAVDGAASPRQAGS
ncbi:MAG: transglycosylase domain-containing protein, partial [Sphingomonadaceae bacterium]|nr:transglycosylase domain-containing protein [Sphingomonadaceae bacterium]